MDNLGPIDIEIIINNPELLASLNQAEGLVAKSTTVMQTEVNKAVAAIERLRASGGLSDSVAEVAAYQNALQGAGDTGRVAISGIDELIRILNADLDAGVVTLAEYQAEMTRLVAIREAGAAATVQDNVATAEQVGLLQGLINKLELANANKLKLIDPAQIAIANAEIQGLTNQIRNLNRAGTAGFDGLNGAATRPVGTIGRLIYAANLYKTAAATSFNPDIIAKYNRKLQETEAQIARTRNIGRVGFDDMGNAVARNTNYLTKGFSVLRNIAYILPGIGIAGLLAFITSPIVNYIASLNLFGNKITLLAAKLNALNEINRQTASNFAAQSANLKVLYALATDVTAAERDRIAAAKELKKEFPEQFANSRLSAILNGEEKKSYEELTLAILSQARAKAVVSNLEDVERKRFELERKKDKISNFRQNQLAQLKRDEAAGKYDGEGGGILSGHQEDNINKSAVESLKEADRQIKILEDQRRFAISYGGGIKKVAEAIYGGTNLIKEPLKKFDEIIKNASQAADLDNLKAALEAKLKALGPNDKQIQTYRDKIIEVEKLQKRYSPKITDGNADADSKKNKIALLNEITEATAAFDRKALSADEQALKAITDKFDQLRAKVVAFNANPKNAGNQVAKATIDRLITQPEKAALGNQLELNTNSAIKADLDEKKALYAEYEAYKEKLGKEAADKEYALLLRSGENFKNYLDNQADEIPTGKITGPLQARADLITKHQLEEKQAEAKKNLELLASTLSYEQQRNLIIERSLQKAAELRAQGAAEQADVAIQQGLKEATALDEAKVKELGAYKELFDGIAIISQKRAQQDLAFLKKYLDNALKAGTITKEAYDKINAQLNSKKSDTLKATPEELRAVASALGGIVTQVSAFDEGLAQALSTVSNILNGVADIKSGFAAINKKGASPLDKIAGGLGIIGTGITIISSIVGLFSNSKQKAEQQAYSQQLQLKAVEAINKALERQLALTKEIYGPERLVAYKANIDAIIAAQKAALESLQNRASLSGDKAIDDLLKANNGGAFTGVLAKAFANFGTSVSLAGKSIRELEDLLNKDLLDDNTAAVVQNLLNLEQQAKDTANALKAEITGTTFDSLNDSITSLFENGEASAANLGKAIEKAIDGAILNSFKRTQVDRAMQPFFDALYNAGLDGSFTDDELAALRAQKDAIAANLQKQADAYNLLTGGSATGSSSSSTLTGAIQGITAEQAGVLEGTFRGVQQAVVEANAISAANGKTIQQQLAEQRTQTLVQMQIEANTRRIADNSDSMRDSLTNIDSNTSSSNLTNAIKAAGI
ncbi:hypothetical protein [Mucilaginibacter sp.]|uniref:hypothetical protein n=1 Tax=Mucilaginibacter sp. TaxID=1882438 RepID=UPI0032661792